jgi:hypothetical protein
VRRSSDNLSTSIGERSTEYRARTKNKHVDRRTRQVLIIFANQHLFSRHYYIRCLTDMRVPAQRHERATFHPHSHNHIQDDFFFSFDGHGSVQCGPHRSTCRTVGEPGALQGRCHHHWNHQRWENGREENHNNFTDLSNGESHRSVFLYPF